MSGILSDLV